MAQLALRLAGIAALLHPDGQTTVLDRHGALLAGRLVLAGPQSRLALAGMLWPNAPAARAGANLRQRLLRLRQGAGQAWVVGDAALQLAPGVVVLPWQDPALGELLQGVDADAEPQLGEWLAWVRRQRLTDQATALAQHADTAEAAGDLDSALALAERLLRLDTLAEAAHRRVARLHYLRHDTARAHTSLLALRAMLHAEFGASPSARSVELEGTLRQAVTPVPEGAPQQAATPPDGAELPAALWRPPQLVGRAPSLAALRAASASGGVVVVCGPPGLGKTRLLQEVAASLPIGQTLLAAALPGDAARPFATLDRLVDALSRQCPAAALSLPTAAAASARRRTLARALMHAGVQCVLLDDLHWADVDSLAVLEALAASGPLDWVFTQLPNDPGRALATLCDRLADAGRLQHLMLAPLDLAAVEHLLHSLALPWLTQAVQPALAERLLAQVGGTPGWLLATLRALPPGLPVAELPHPPAVVQAIEHRLQRLPPTAQALARVLAVAGAPADASLAATVMRQPVSALMASWCSLASSQLLSEDGFTPALVRQVVLDGLPGALRQGLHAEVAAALEAQAPEAPADPAAVARHWEAAGQARRSVLWWWRVADQAHRQWRARDEADALAHAIAHTEADAPALAMALLLRQARVVVESDGIAAPLAPLGRALQLAGSDPERIQVLNRLAEVHFNRLMPEASRQCAEQALALALQPAAGQAGAPTPWPAAAAEAVVRLHRALCLAGRAAQAEQLWQQHRHWVERGPWHGAELVSDRGWVLDRLGRSRDARAWHQRGLALALASGRPVDEAVVLGNLAQGLLLAGEPAAAEQVLGQAAASAARHAGWHQASDYHRIGLASAAAAQGHYDQALGLFELALVDSQHQSPIAHSSVRLRRALLWAEIGQTARALADLAPVLATEALPPWTAARARRLALALQAAPQADPVDRLQALLDDTGDAAQWGQHGPAQLALLRLQSQRSAAEAEAAWRLARQLWRRAVAAGHPGLRWAAHWVAAQAALAAGRHRAAARHAGACLQRPADQVPAELPEGLWWHGLWRLWLALGEPARADQARAQGIAWIEHTVQQHLAAHFHRGFCQGLEAHRQLLAGAPQPGWVPQP